MTDALRLFAQEGKLLAAICAAPSVLGEQGLLQGKKATSYPGFAENMPGAVYVEDDVVWDGNVITSRGMGTAIAFGLEIVEMFTDKETAEALGKKVVYKLS